LVDARYSLVVSVERFRVAAAVYGVLVDGERVLLMRRAGSGYHDGELSLPAGHLNGGEDALSGLVRELREELGVTIDRNSCRLAVLLHRPPETAGDHEYLDLVFTVDGWAGTPSINEPDKCSELVWADRNHLPADLVDYVNAALQALTHDDPLLLYGWHW
jgi:8-oxo-dGTP diphosphatase